MRRRRALLVCTIGIAVCLVFLGFQQSPPTDDPHLRHHPRVGDDDDADDSDPSVIAVETAGGGKSPPFRYQSLRYLTPAVEQQRPAGRPQTNVSESSSAAAAFVDGLALLRTGSATSASAAGGVKMRRHKFARNMSRQPPDWPSTLYYDPASPPDEFRDWNATATVLCSSPPTAAGSFFRRAAATTPASQFTAYANLFAELRDVVVDRKYCRADRKGGEMIDDVVGQDESSEYYRVEPGCFQLACDRLPAPAGTRLYNFIGDAHLDQWMSNGVRFVGSDRQKQLDEDTEDGGTAEETVFDGFTIAVVRYEYANLFHTTTDWYNAFLMMQFFGRTAAETNILVVDAHPFGALDSVWTRLFGSVTRLSALARRTRFRQLVWSIVGYESPMKIFAPSPVPPLFDAFRRHVLASYNIDAASTDAEASRRRDGSNCSALSVLFIWRRDYLAHPRNPTGRVQRKIANESELIDYVRRRRPSFRVDGVQIDLLDVGDQLSRIVEADIVVGVHGAGLTHAAFMRPDAALAELSPNDIWSANQHFEAIADWRRLAYMRWTNHDFRLEDEDAGTLRVPGYVANAIIGKLSRRICRSGGSVDAAVASDAAPAAGSKIGFAGSKRYRRTTTTAANSDFGETKAESSVVKVRESAAAAAEEKEEERRDGGERLDAGRNDVAGERQRPSQTANGAMRFLPKQPRARTPERDVVHDVMM